MQAGPSVRTGQAFAASSQQAPSASAKAAEAGDSPPLTPGRRTFPGSSALKRSSNANGSGRLKAAMKQPSVSSSTSRAFCSTGADDSKSVP